MQFQVPQFIEVEDKIFGPLTFKQFIYMGGGAGAAYLLWRLLPFYIAIPLIAGDLGLAAALAFMKINGRPFIQALESGFFYVIHPRLYLWNNVRKAAKKTTVIPAKEAEVYIPKLSESKLHELAWSLDIKERIAGGSADESDRARYDAMKPIRTGREAMVK